MFSEAFFDNWVARIEKVRDRNLESSFKRLITASNENNFQTQNFLEKDFIRVYKL